MTCTPTLLEPIKPTHIFPNLRGRVMYLADSINGSVNAVRMERLAPLSADLYPLVDYMHMRLRHPDRIAAETKNAICSSYPKLETALRLIKPLLKHGCICDFKYTNVMLRGAVPVIIDPVSGENED